MSEHDRRLNDQGALIQRIFEKIDLLAENTRKPGWVTTSIISLLTFGLGSTITVIAVLVKKMG